LSPDFGGAPNAIAVPQDPKSSPAYIFQQLALQRHRASSQPSFSSRLQESHFIDSETEEEDDGSREETPTPNSRTVKEKPNKTPKNKDKKSPKEKKKKKNGGDATDKDKSARKKNKPDEARDEPNHAGTEPKTAEKVRDKVADAQENSAKTPNSGKTKKKKKTPNDKAARETDKKKRAQIPQEAVEAGMYHSQRPRSVSLSGPTNSRTAPESRKRKRDNVDEEDEQGELARPPADGDANVLHVEALAIQRLQESVPAVRKRHVEHKLRQETGHEPSELAVLITAARETIIDLARQQVMQTQQSYHALQTELLRLLKEQTARLERLEEKERAEEEQDEEDERSAADLGDLLRNTAAADDDGSRHSPGPPPAERHHRRHGRDTPGCSNQVQ
jgi:hypothetical protein